MVAIVNTFTYTGTVNHVTIPAGTESIDMYLWGGAGGGGGNDQGPGGVGSGGSYVKKLSYSVAGNIGDTLQVAVGGGGAGGASGGGAPGGVNGKSLTDYSGGTGGSAGPTPYSGGGGAGGGATVVTVNGTAVAVAGGGGGGGGGGQHSGGGAGINSNSATARSPGTLGENGASHSGDGGGGGAGGGGADGGVGGAGGNGDNGGTAGYSGSNLVPSSGSEDNGSGTTPGGTSEGYYSAGIGVGAPDSSTGGNGKAVVVFNVGVQASTKVSGTWKDINAMYTKVSGVWKQITASYYKVSGTWKALFNSGITFLSTAAGFGNVTGNTPSGSSGSGGGCFIAGTLVTMVDGSQKAVELVDIRDKVAIGGFVFATGKFLINNLYDYNGIKVAGSHMVKENNKWVRVRDSEIGKSLGTGDHVVYIFGCENRRILINKILFTDYFEVNEKIGLQKLGEKYFNEYREHSDALDEEVVDFINKK